MENHFVLHRNHRVKVILVFQVGCCVEDSDEDSKEPLKNIAEEKGGKQVIMSKQFVLLTPLLRSIKFSRIFSEKYREGCSWTAQTLENGEKQSDT